MVIKGLRNEYAAGDQRTCADNAGWQERRIRHEFPKAIKQGGHGHDYCHKRPDITGGQFAMPRRKHVAEPDERRNRRVDKPRPVHLNSRRDAEAILHQVKPALAVHQIAHLGNARQIIAVWQAMAALRQNILEEIGLEAKRGEKGGKQNPL